MGNHSYFPMQALVFVQHLQDRCFGEIDVFRTQDARFVMKVIRSHIVGDMKHTVFKKILQWLKTNNNQFIVPLMHIQNKVEKGLCIQYEVSEVYTEYFNFTFLDLLRSKKGLEQSQLWFIFQVLLSITTTLRKMKLGINISVDKVFLTLKGYPCVYFHHFVSLQDSFTYSQFAMGQRVAIIMLQLCLGEEIRNIQDLQQQDFLIYLGKACSKFKMMGRLIKELLNRESTEEEVLEKINLSIEKGQINAFTEIKLAKFRYALPNENNSSALKNSESQSKVNQTTNRTVDFRPKKHSMNKKMSASLKQEENKSPLTQKLSTQPSLEFPLNAMNKQSTTKILDGINKKKQECRLKMQQILRKKQLMNHPQKQNFTIHNQIKTSTNYSKPKQKKVVEQIRGYKQR